MHLHPPRSPRVTYSADEADSFVYLPQRGGMWVEGQARVNLPLPMPYPSNLQHCQSGTRP